MTTLAEQLRERIRAKRQTTPQQRSEGTGRAEETPEQREKRIMDDPACWDGTTLGGSRQSILPR